MGIVVTLAVVSLTVEATASNVVTSAQLVANTFAIVVRAVVMVVASRGAVAAATMVTSLIVVAAVSPAWTGPMAAVVRLVTAAVSSVSDVGQQHFLLMLTAAAQRDHPAEASADRRH